MDINQLMKQAQDMQRQLEKANEEINSQTFEGLASNGLVKVIMNGEYKITNVDIDQSIINKDDKEMIEDLIMIASNDASKKVDEAKTNKFGSMAKGLGL